MFSFYRDLQNLHAIRIQQSDVLRFWKPGHKQTGQFYQLILKKVFSFSCYNADVVWCSFRKRFTIHSLISGEIPCEKSCINPPWNIIYAFSVGWTVTIAHVIPISGKGSLKSCVKFSFEYGPQQMYYSPTLTKCSVVYLCEIVSFARCALEITHRKEVTFVISPHFNDSMSFYLGIVRNVWK